MDGVVAQLVEHLVRNEKVRGSTPLGSTILSLYSQLVVCLISPFRPRILFDVPHPSPVAHDNETLSMNRHDACGLLFPLRRGAGDHVSRSERLFWGN